MGSVFSPYYAWARRRDGPAVDPENHVCINVALYGAGGHRWAMTERGKSALNRTASSFSVGPSCLHWNGRWFELRFRERECPWPTHLTGHVRIHPGAFTDFSADLDPGGRHRWTPVAPCSRVEVAIDHGGPRWSGHGYLDSNDGDEPIHRPFRRWDWSRTTMPDGSSAVLYDVQLKAGEDRLVAQHFWPDGRSEPFEAPPRQRLPSTAWGIERSTRCDTHHRARVMQTFENTPFYVRDQVESSLLGRAGLAVHESLDARRLAAWPIRLMLPFRMPRWTGHAVPASPDQV